MDRMRILAVALTLVLIVSMVVGAQSVEVANANMVPPPPYEAHIDSPIHHGKYATRDIPLNVVVNGNTNGIVVPVNYSVYHDPSELPQTGWSAPGESVIKGSTPLGEFNGTGWASQCVYNSTLHFDSDGYWAVMVWVADVGGISEFSIDTGEFTPPIVRILDFRANPQNASEVLLSFFTSEPLASLAYYLDHPSKIPLPPCNQTITEIPPGSHIVIFYATDLSGNPWTSEVFNLIIPQPTPAPTSIPSPSVSPGRTLSLTIEPSVEPSSTPKQQTGFLGTNLPGEYGYAIVVAVVVVVVLAVGALAIRRRRKVLV
jgi:hypothetical protein